MNLAIKRQRLLFLFLAFGRSFDIFLLLLLFKAKALLRSDGAMEMLADCLQELLFTVVQDSHAVVLAQEQESAPLVM